MSNVVILTDQEWGRGKTGGQLFDGKRYCILGSMLRSLGQHLEEGDSLPSVDHVEVLSETGVLESCRRRLMDFNDMVGLDDKARVANFNDVLKGTGWEIFLAQTVDC